MTIVAEGGGGALMGRVEVRLEAGEVLCNCSLQASLCGLAKEGPYKFVCKTRGGCLKHVYRPEPERHPDVIRTEYR